MNYDKIIMSFEKDIINGLLVKWLNTLPSQGKIHGFEFHTGHHFNYKDLISLFFLLFFNN